MTKNQVKTWAFCLLMAGALAACSPKEVRTGNLNVIPQPQEIIEAQNASPFIIKSSTTICYPEGNEKLAHTAHLLASYIKEVTGTEVKTGTEAGKNCIVLGIDPDIAHKDGYELNITSDQITVNGSTEAGVFYGAQTIHKALPITAGKATASLPAGTVKDFPRFDYRGFMIDVGRHFFSVDYLKELIDVMALHNINYFHWHLTEDQGWRIEIKKYPKLTEVGSYRKETISAPGSKKFDGTPVSGFYTQEEAKEIVNYAKERFITVIPEIDMPGHMLAALASYPELGCTGGPYETATKFGVFREVLCGGNEKTLQFAKDHGAKTIALTDNAQAPIVEFADCSLFAKSDVMTIVDSLVCALSVVNALVTAIALLRKDDVEKRLMALEEIWNEYDVYNRSADYNNF